jgi:raffinose/stachyose/melibiose transport system substrate-binding protein
LVQLFNKTHPLIHIDMISQPSSNFFALFQAASISRTGPDLTELWTGLWTLEYGKYLLNLNNLLPKAMLNQYTGLSWESANFNVKDGLYVLPWNVQFYNGFYNKKLFREAGLSGPPETWSQLFHDCAVLKAKGITPLIVGSSSGSAGSEFYPYYAFTYMVAADYPLSQWKSLYDGRIPWTSKPLVAQLTRWHQLVADGYTNPDILTEINAQKLFAQGGGAMYINGSWFLGDLESALGNNLGVFVPPFSNKPLKVIVEYPGDGIGITRYSKHVPQAVEFLKFLSTPQAIRIMLKQGLIPDIKGVTTPNPGANALLAFANKDGYQVLPMLDNVTAPEVVNVAQTQLDAAVAGDESPMTALQAMEAALKHLPASQGNSW